MYEANARMMRGMLYDDAVLASEDIVMKRAKVASVYRMDDPIGICCSRLER